MTSFSSGLPAVRPGRADSFTRRTADPPKRDSYSSSYSSGYAAKAERELAQARGTYTTSYGASYNASGGYATSYALRDRDPPSSRDRDPYSSRDPPLGQRNTYSSGLATGYSNSSVGDAKRYTRPGLRTPVEPALPPTLPRGACAAAPSPAPASSNSAAVLCCDKCDGKHETERCPYYKKPRENHPDALRRKPPEMGRPCGNKVVPRARVIRQPGDGNCLYHSLSYGLGGPGASALRRDLADWVRQHPNEEIAETPIKDWVLWDSRLSPDQYARRMGISGWGGGIELAACSRAKRVNVHVWENDRLSRGYRRISCFDCPGGSARTINVIYQGGVHYDAIEF
eukprot:TRINITY_DN1367_c0_g2_i1.p1 TRINITY_DN1367_c0_g2~~TRINITY_DN1367_c0_g2_i1.p1  ORF type:complete len:369 (+),score=101.30 TRINITY_DN1367_c0_g2_i1:86-1108(+)